MAGISRVRRWFSSVSYLPAWGEDLRRFMSGTIGLAAGLVFGHQAPNIVWGEVSSAYADRPKNQIVISADMLSSNETKRLRPEVSKDEAIAAVLGTLVHEIGHFVYSPDNLLGFLNAGVPDNLLATTIANIVEDVFIERAIVDREPTYDWMISASWDYFFPDSIIEKTLENWDGETFEDLGAVLNVMTSWKKGSYFFSPRTELEKTLYDMVRSVIGMYELQDRKDLIEKIYRFLLDERMKQTGEDIEKEMEEQEGGSGDGEGGSGSLEEAIKELLEQIEKLGEMAETTEGKLVEVAKVRTVYGESDATAYTSRYNFIDFSVAGKMGVAWSKLNQSTGGRLNFPAKWLEFRKWAVDMGTVRRIRGHAGNTGKLTHPARLTDDGKIFSKARTSSPSGATGFEGSPQTILLVDLSGSMSGYIAGSRRKEKVHEACEVAQGAMEGLLGAKHRVAVYGHSTSNVGMNAETCIIYVAKEFSDTQAAGTNGLYNMHLKGALSNNADSYAIEAVASKFKFDGSPMRIFVISDGEPACYLYRGRDGDKETKAVVDGLRRKGIEVYSFSIDSEAISSNNFIYGKDHNFDAQNMDVVRQVLRRFV